MDESPASGARLAPKLYIEKASASGWISSFTSGEGLVCRFRGPGNIMIQTRNPQVFGQWMNPLLPARG